jgi:hypothetical protein
MIQFSWKTSHVIGSEDELRPRCDNLVAESRADSAICQDRPLRFTEM